MNTIMSNRGEYCNMKQETKFVIKILTTVMIFLFLFVILIYINEKQNNMQNFNEVGENITSQTSRALEHWIEDQVRVVQTIANDHSIIDVCNNPQNETLIREAQTYLNDIHRRYPYYENLPIAVKLGDEMTREVNNKKIKIENGTFLIDTVGNRTLGKGGLEYSYIKEVLAGKDYYISEIYPSILRNNPIFVISVPVNNKDGEIIGVAIISPQIEYFTRKFVESVHLGQSGYLFFMDKRGQVIAHENRNFILKHFSEVDPKIDNVMTKILNNERYFEGKAFGKTKHYVSTRVNLSREHEAYDWYIVFTQTNREIFKSSTSFLKLIIPMVLITIIFIAGIVNAIAKINQKEIYEENLRLSNRSLEKKVKERTKELEKMVLTDGLTGLFNHKTSYEKLEGIINKAQESRMPLTIMMCDLDHFKRVNDTFGHQTGDEVLLRAAQTILSSVREVDVAGRYGGEEFIIILPDTDLAEGIHVANRIKGAVAALDFSQEDLKVTISLGVCMWEGESAIDLVSKVDKLLYQAKRNGRNRIESELEEV